MAQSVGGYASNLPILDGKNWTRWSIQVNEIFVYQGVEEVLEEGLKALAKNATDVEVAAFKRIRKKNAKAICLVHQAVDNVHFERIARAKTAKEAWGILEKHYEGAPQLKEIKLQSMRRLYELMEMDEAESISEFFSRLVIHVTPQP